MLSILMIELQKRSITLDLFGLMPHENIHVMPIYKLWEEFEMQQFTNRLT